MNCPQCNVTLLITERQEVEIDYCPQCRGVWLDRGELDKLLQRSAPYRKDDDDDDDDRKRRADPYIAQPYRKKKREGFLADLFDF